MCSLPKLFCEAGCIYREQSFRHLACPTALKNKKDCVLPDPVHMVMKANNRTMSVAPNQVVPQGNPLKNPL